MLSYAGNPVSLAAIRERRGEAAINWRRVGRAGNLVEARCDPDATGTVAECLDPGAPPPPWDTRQWWEHEGLLSGHAATVRRPRPRVLHIRQAPLLRLQGSPAEHDEGQPPRRPSPSPRDNSQPWSHGAKRQRLYEAAAARLRPATMGTAQHADAQGGPLVQSPMPAAGASAADAHTADARNRTASVAASARRRTHCARQLRNAATRRANFCGFLCKGRELWLDGTCSRAAAGALERALQEYRAGLFGDEGTDLRMLAAVYAYLGLCLVQAPRAEGDGWRLAGNFAVCGSYAPAKRFGDMFAGPWGHGRCAGELRENVAHIVKATGPVRFLPGWRRRHANGGRAELEHAMALAPTVWGQRPASDEGELDREACGCIYAQTINWVRLLQRLALGFVLSKGVIEQFGCDTDAVQMMLHGTLVVLRPTAADHAVTTWGTDQVVQRHVLATPIGVSDGERASRDAVAAAVRAVHNKSD